MKQKILLLHGALGSKQQLEPLQQHLAHRFEVFSLNFSGHGGETFTADFKIDLFVQEVKAFINTMDIAPIAIFGYSMGGYVALRLARQSPSLISKIFTLGTKMEWTPEIVGQELKQLQPDLIEEKVPAFAQILQQRHAPNDWKEVLSQTAGLMTDLGQGNKLMAEDFKAIAHPVVICRGALDRMVSNTESQEVASLLSNGSYQEISEAKHPIEKVNPEILAQAISHFLTN